ncbi:hypothetical protein BGZ76_005761 [Entomortierella beljakovae]|nr:hypothetical protein BGZ76_005761 [Entomortierella beljakovae]
MAQFEQVNATFLSWLENNGATISKSISLQDYSSEGAGRGVVSIADIKKDEELFSISRPLLLCPETSEFSKKVDLTSLQGWNPLMICMIYEYCRGENSQWKPYFDILPTEFSTLMFWDEDELKELKGTGAADKVGRDEAELVFKENLWPLISANLNEFSIEEKDEASFLKIFHRMGSLIMAYAFHDTLPDKDEDEDMEDEDEDEEEEEEEKVNVSMVPMADMLNHKTGHNNARLFHEKDCLRMVAIKPIKAGQQIYNTYGDLCNADLLRKYGFVDVPNPHNIAEISGELVVAKFRAGLEEGKEEIIEWLLEQEALEDYFILESDGEIPEDLVGCAKILMMPIEEFKTTVLKEKKIPSTKLNIQVQKILRELLEEKIAGYESNAKEDKALLKQADQEISINKKNAVIVRSGERDIVQSVLEKVKKWRPPTPAPASNKQKVAPQSEENKTTTTEHKPQLTLPAPGDVTPLAPANDLQVNGPDLKLDHLGPVVVNENGTISRIDNWHEMTEIEKSNVKRILVLRNNKRLAKLRAEQDKQAQKQQD